MGINLLEDHDGVQMATRSVDSVVTSSLMSEVLKKTTHEQRPDGSGHSSFPSGHATAAFAAATMQSEYHPIQTPLWITGASLIAASRVKLHRHYVHDVVAGALLGAGTSELELYSRKGLLLFPIIEPESHSVAVQAMLDW
jgi:membrane-associated phospholipid phosphatase